MTASCIVTRLNVFSKTQLLSQQLLSLHCYKIYFPFLSKLLLAIIIRIFFFFMRHQTWKTFFRQANVSNKLRSTIYRKRAIKNCAIILISRKLNSIFKELFFYRLTNNIVTRNNFFNTQPIVQSFSSDTSQQTTHVSPKKFFPLCIFQPVFLHRNIFSRPFERSNSHIF